MEVQALARVKRELAAKATKGHKIKSKNFAFLCDFLRLILFSVLSLPFSFDLNPPYRS